MSWECLKTGVELPLDPVIQRWDWSEGPSKEAERGKKGVGIGSHVNREPSFPSPVCPASSSFCSGLLSHAPRGPSKARHGKARSSGSGSGLSGVPHHENSMPPAESFRSDGAWSLPERSHFFPNPQWRHQGGRRKKKMAHRSGSARHRQHQRWHRLVESFCKFPPSSKVK